MTGKRHTDALELEVNGRITPAWDAVVSYAHMRGKIDKAAGSAENTQGKTPLNTPRNTLAVWNSYAITPQIKVGAGLEYVGKRFANNTNTNSVPGYTRIDAMAQYDISNNVAVKVNVLNLFNREYTEGVYGGHSVPGTTRAVQATLTGKF